MFSAVGNERNEIDERFITMGDYKRVRSISEQESNHEHYCKAEMAICDSSYMGLF